MKSRKINKSRLALAITAGTLGALAQQAVAAGFIEDSKASLTLRNFYINTDNRNGSASPSKQEEWGQGFILNYQSGFTQGTVGFGVDALGLLGVRLDGGGRAGKSGLDRQPGTVFPLESNGEPVHDFASLGLTAKAKVSNTEFRYGTLQPKLPVVTYNDGRLLPQTFQGGMLTSREIAGLTLHGGQMRSLSQRNSSDHQDLSVDGRGGVFSDRFDYLGAEYRFNAERSQVGLWQARLQDIYRQDYYSLSHKQSFGGWRLGASVGLFDTRDEGAAKLGDLENRALTGFFSATRGRHSLGAGYQRMYGDDGMLYIAGTSTPLVNDIQVRNFTSAGERSWQLRYDYDFVGLGIPGLTFMTRYVKGDNIDLLTTSGEGKEWERDMDIAYVFQSGPLKNLGVKWRNATMRTNYTNDYDENRLIVSYTLPLW